MSSTSVIKDQENEEKHKKEIKPLFKNRRRSFRSQYSNDEETLCGIWIFKGAFLQKFANKKAFILLYGTLGCLYGACYAYFNGTITTLEKRFKFNSKTTGIITIGNDLSQLLVAIVLSYYAGRKHKPRWMALGMFSVVLFCILSASPHFLYGPGEDALQLTKEYGPNYNKTNLTKLIDTNSKRTVCKSNNNVTAECAIKKGSSAPIFIMFLGQFISGIGSLYYSLGVSYMDDNIKKSKTPVVISISFFLKMLGPMIGYSLASFCLKIYVSPSLTPVITNHDQRWLGAWWLGWLFLAFPIFFLSIILSFFPKSLPRAAARRQLQRQRSKISNTTKNEQVEVSFKDMVKTFKRLLGNSTLMLNNFAAVFYFLGYMPYWIFLPKYIESIFRRSASESSLITGTVSLIFSAIGVLISGLVITKFKPRARYLAGWNVVVGGAAVLGMISYAFLGCEQMNPSNPSNSLNSLNSFGMLNPKLPCNENCNCDYVKYNPVCSEDGKMTFISACHAGCTQKQKFNDSYVYLYCACFNQSTSLKVSPPQENTTHSMKIRGGKAYQGNCPVDCNKTFYIFLAVVCILKFIGATGRASNFLVTVRCVEEKDKPVAMGLGMAITSLCAFIPSPILFGYILDKACLVWGKTCTGTGNCWLYNSELLRYRMNFTAATFTFIGTLFDLGVWYCVKDLKIFEEEVELELDDINEDPHH